MNGHSRSTLFLMEQLVVILIFAICAAACVTIFVESYIREQKTLDTNYALLVASSAAESYKAAPGALTAYYDENWDPCEEPRAVHVLQVLQTGESPLYAAEITVSRTDGEELISLTVASRGDGR